MTTSASDHSHIDLGLDGLWSMPSTGSPGQMEYMVFDCARQRIVMFLAAQFAGSAQRQTICYWYEQAAQGVITVRSKSPGKEILDPYAIEDSTLYWLRHGRKYPWRRVTASATPAWLSDRLPQVHRHMDAKETGAAASLSGSFPVPDSPAAQP